MSAFVFRGRKALQRRKAKTSGDKEEDTERSAEGRTSKRRWRKVRGMSRFASAKKKRAVKKKPESSSDSDEEEEESTTTYLLSRLGVVGGVVPLTPRVSDTSVPDKASEQGIVGLCTITDYIEQGKFCCGYAVV